MKKEDPVLFTIENEGIFVDGFRFTAAWELEAYSADWIKKAKEQEKILKQ